MKTNKIMQHAYVSDYSGKAGSKSAKAYIKRQCRRLLRRTLKDMVDE